MTSDDGNVVSERFSEACCCNKPFLESSTLRYQTLVFNCFHVFDSFLTSSFLPILAESANVLSLGKFYIKIFLG